MKLFGIIGSSINESPSPDLYNTVFKKLGLSRRYIPISVGKREFPNLIRVMQVMDFAGLNVTIPYKEKIILFLDGLDKSAKLCGAVNTIVQRGNQFIGYNTDGAGFVAALRAQKKCSPRGKRILILGSGGAARGIAAALASHNAKEISFLGRNKAKTKRLVHFFRKKFPKTEWKAGLAEEIDLVIQTTPVSPHFPFDKLPSTTIVCDIRLHPLRTNFLKRARQAGLRTMDGRGMFLHQARLNIKLWAGNF